MQLLDAGEMAHPLVKRAYPFRGSASSQACTSSVSHPFVTSALEYLMPSFGFFKHSLTLSCTYPHTNTYN